MECKQIRPTQIDSVDVWESLYHLGCVFVLQGGAPSPFDRNFGTKLGVKATQWISEKLTENFRQGGVLLHSQKIKVLNQAADVCWWCHYFPSGRVFSNSPETACVLGLNRKVISFIPVTDLKASTDFEYVLWRPYKTAAFLWKTLNQIIYGYCLFAFQAPDAHGSVVVQPETDAEDAGQVSNQFCWIRPWRDGTCDSTLHQHWCWILKAPWGKTSECSF